MAWSIPWEWITPVVGMLGACGLFVLRLLESKRPVTARSLLMPPLGMSTGAAMFLFPASQVPWAWAGLALFIGACCLSPILMATSTLVYNKGQVWMRSSPVLPFVLILLILGRWIFRAWIEQYADWVQTAGLGFLLAFGMLAPWRLSLYFRYRKLQLQVGPPRGVV